MCCRNRVKFWFIKNYMSPQMKRFLPLMAEHYGFEYEFVTYKWPTWLHKQVSLLLSISCPAHTAHRHFESSSVMHAPERECYL